MPVACRYYDLRYVESWLNDAARVLMFKSKQFRSITYNVYELYSDSSPRISRYSVSG